MITLNADPVLLIYRPSGNGKNDFTVPLPIYLSEKLTGLCVDSETDMMSISTDYVPTLKKDTAAATDGAYDVQVQQKGETQQTRIVLVGNKNSPGLNLLLPVLKTVMSYVFARQDYKIAYFHQNVLIFNARLASYEVAPGSNDTKVTITITLEVPPQKADANGQTQTPVIGYSWDQVQTGVAP